MRDEETIRSRIRHTLRVDRALRLVWDGSPKWTTLSALLLLVQGLLPLPALYLMKLTVDAVAEGLTSADAGTAFGPVALYIALAAGIALLGSLCGSLATLAGEAQAQAVTDHVSDLLHAKSIQLDLEYYESPRYFDALHRAQQEAPYRPPRIVNGLVEVGQSSISLLAMAALLFSFHWGVVAILCAVALPGVLLRMRFAGKLYQWQRQRTQTERLAWYYHWLLAAGEHAKEIRVLDLGDLFRGRYRDLRALLRRERLGLSARRAGVDLVAQTSTNLAVYGAYAFMAYRAVQGAITLGDLIMYYQAFQRGLDFFQQVLRGVASLYEDSLFLSYYYQFLDLEPKVTEPASPQPVPVPVRSGVVFDRVSFRYPTGDQMALKGVTLHIPAGKTVALVGENGSGKTTLVKLLCRLYDPMEGTISIDGIDLREMETTALRRWIGVVFQDYARYDLTARENIWLGDCSLPLDDDRIVAAARSAGAEGVVSKLPRGFDTVLGHSFEDGRELSVGEWQKIALARTLIRDAQIVVLDEPTSALDAQAEDDLIARLRRLASGRTTLLISHRFSTVRMADLICVLEGGKLVESGTHEELLARGGRYALMFETQARHYS